MRGKSLIPVAALALLSLSPSAFAQVCDDEGVFLGQLSATPYIVDSTANKFGAFGSPYSPMSVNNPYSQYGIPYSPISPNNPYATQAPVLCGDEE